MSTPRPETEFESAIRSESNRALQLGSRLAVVLAIASVLATVGLAVSNPAFWPATIFPGACVVVALVVWLFARKERVYGRATWAIFLGFASVPTLSLVFFERILPWGAATYFFGPIAVGWTIVVLLTGFTLQPRLSVVVGVYAAVSYLATFALARPHLLQLPESIDSTFRADVLGWEVQLIRSMLLVGIGVLVASTSSLTLRLLGRVRDEVVEREAVSRLFGQYVSEDVKDKLVKGGAHLTGERKVVAVLFSDLRGFTTFSEGRTPAEVVELLNRYFDAMVRAISQHGGTVDKFIGDAVMATFGGLGTLENPASSALAAAREMRRALASLNAAWAHEGLPQLDNGIGVHFGEVLQGPIGAAQRKEFTVIGDVVNTASRLESATKELGAHVVVSDAFAQALSEAERQSLRALGEAKLKGKERGVQVYAAD
ncbi:MAG: adenylate/guanylate cyclase domain-containing protein [Myxococcaceae bacterium]